MTDVPTHFKFVVFFFSPTVWLGVESVTKTQSLRSILNHFNRTRNVYVDPAAKQRALDFIVKSFKDHGLDTWTEEFPSNQEKVYERSALSDVGGCKRKRKYLVGGVEGRKESSLNKQFFFLRALFILHLLSIHLRNDSVPH